MGGPHYGFGGAGVCSKMCQNVERKKILNLIYLKNLSTTIRPNKDHPLTYCFVVSLFPHLMHIIYIYIINRDSYHPLFPPSPIKHSSSPRELFHEPFFNSCKQYTAIHRKIDWLPPQRLIFNIDIHLQVTIYK